MTYRNHFLLIALLTCISTNVFAQLQLQVERTRSFGKNISVHGRRGYLFWDKTRTYNMSGNEVYTHSNGIKDIQISPSGYGYAGLTFNEKKWELDIVDFSEKNRRIKGYPQSLQPRAVVYSADARKLFVFNAMGDIRVFETSKYTCIDTLAVGIVPNSVTTSPNDYFIAATTDNGVDVINQSTGKIRKHIEVAYPLDIRFSDDGLHMAILTNDKIDVYSTKDFNVSHTFTDFTDGRTCDFDAGSKYICVGTLTGDIVFFNLYNDKENYKLIEPNSKVNYLDLSHADSTETAYLIYKTEKNITLKKIKGIKPNYNRIMLDELNTRMLEWCAKQLGETEEEFAKRVTEENKQKQKRIFANEISTKLAGELIEDKPIVLSRYNAAQQTLAMTVEGLPTFYLNVPQEDVSFFDSGESVELSDVMYGLNEKDEFEIIFANVHNKKSGKVYTFNNLERVSLNHLETDDNFVPLEIIQQVNAEKAVLQGIQKKVVDEAQEKNLITDHTHINVNTKVATTFDADGNRIKNYEVAFDYAVDAEFSARDDYAPGKYQVKESNAATAMLNIVKSAFENEFAEYIKEGKKITINIVGAADALPIRNTIAYNGIYGNFEGEPYYNNNQLNNITITKKTGIASNEQLAFLRAVGIKQWIDTELSLTEKMDAKYNFNVEVSREEGSEYRRIRVSFTFIDAF